MSVERRRWQKTEFTGQERMVTPVSVHRPRAEVTEISLLEPAIKAYKEAWEANTLTPELVNQTWNAFWRDRVVNAGLDRMLQIPVCDRTPEELAELRNNNRSVVLLPEEVMGNRPLLANLFPEFRDTISLSSKLTAGGCVDIETETMMTNTGRTRFEMKKEIQDAGRQGQRFETYVIGSVFNKLLTGEFFDHSESERGYSTLSGSQFQEGIATGYPAEIKNYKIIFNQGHSSYHGFRTEGRKAHTQ